MNSEVRSLMSRNLVTIKASDTIDWARSVMSDRGIRHLPVVDEATHIVGVLSDRDVKRAMRPDAPFDPAAKVGNFMSWPIATLSIDDTISHAARKMVDEKISSLLVVENESIVGILTSEDLLRRMIEAHDDSREDDRFQSSADFDRDDGGRERGHNLRDDVQAALYNSPIGPLAHTLANVGV